MHSTGERHHHKSRAHKVLSRVRDPSRPHWRDLKRVPRRLTPPLRQTHISIEGWDTETTDGQAFVMACSQGWRPIDSLEDALSFLGGRHARGKRNFWWNLRFDVDAITKWDEDVASKLRDEGQARYGDVRLSYLPKKMLKITRKGHTCYHYDLYQFYNLGLEKAAQRYLYRPAPAIKHDRSRLWLYPKPEVGAYCQWDATATRDLGFLFVRGMHAINLYPKHFISKGNVAKIACLSEADISTWMDQPNRVTSVAWEAFRAGWVDLWQRGTMECHKADLNSAYPHAMRYLPDFKQGEWVEGVAKEADVGYAVARVTYGPETPPLLSSYLTKTLYYPMLDQPTRIALALPELRFLQRHASVEVEWAYSYIPRHPDVYPWRDVIDRLLSQKKASKGDYAAYMAAKETVNSCYGNLVETLADKKEVRPGRLFNVIAGAHTTACCRVALAEAVMQAGDATIAVATDSIASTRPLRLDYGDELGQWEIEAEGKVGTFIQPGIYQVDGERSHTRGFKPPANLLQRLETDSDSIEITWHRPWTMAEALHHNDFSKANLWHEERKQISLANSRRLWLERPQSFRDLLSNRFRSIPVPLSAHPTA